MRRLKDFQEHQNIFWVCTPKVWVFHILYYACMFDLKICVACNTWSGSILALLPLPRSVFDSHPFSTQSTKSQAVQQQNWQNWNDNTSRHWKKSRSYSTFSQPELRTMNKKSYFFLQSMWLLNVLRGPLGNNNAKGVGPWLRDEIMSSLVGSYRTLILWLNVFKQLDMAG